MSKPTVSDSPSLVSPGARAAIIAGGFFLGLISLSTFAIYREASRIKHERESTRLANRDHTQTGDVVWIAPGTFTMGGIGASVPDDELPLHDVKLDGFYIDRTDVTNEEFSRFVEATGYVTVAERPASATTTPGLPVEFEGKPVSLCFRAPKPDEKVDASYRRWELREGANWRHPEGEGSDIKGREKHPVVHICYDDAVMYSQWAGKRLPTEAEWEFAARGGLIAQAYVWGSKATADGAWMANTWQGHFPEKNLASDGFAGTSPVGSFHPNGYGLSDMAGDVWQLTADWYRPDYYAALARNPDWQARHDPKGPPESYDPEEPGVPKRVARGGSFLSSDQYPCGYRPSARLKIAPRTSSQDTGFRCVRDGRTQ